MVDQKQTEYRPDMVFPPGDTLAEILEDIGMSQADLARRTGLSTKTVNGIIRAREPLTPDTALLLEKVLGVKARFWNRLERNFSEHLARVEEQKRMAENVSWLKELPVREMKKRGWLPNTRDAVALVDAALKFFGVASRKEWEEISLPQQFAYRKSEKSRFKPGHVAAWLRAGEVEAQEIECDEYDKSGFKKTLAGLRSYTTEPPEVFEHQIVSRCAEEGVAVVFTPQIPGAPIFGATRWVNKNKAMIQLSLRYKTSDQLWFSLFHEAGHILLHGKKDVFIELNGSHESEQEDEADRFARDLLIPMKAYKTFVGEGRFTKLEILKFASSVGVHSGIVVGRLQHEGLLPFKTTLNREKMRLKWAVAS